MILSAPPSPRRRASKVSWEMKYRTIIADPPWPYAQPLGRGKKAGVVARGGLPYSAMTIQSIAQMPIQRLADDDCQLWLWTTNSHIHEALHVIDAWGFTYKTMATWAKTQIGLGYWLRGQTEHCILAIKGHPRAKLTGPNGATGNAWSTLITAPRSDHSTKPQAFYDMAENIGESPRLELFARRLRLGWDAWGDEAKTIELPKDEAQ